MPVYRLTHNAIEPLPETSFAQHKVKERADLQRLLRANISVVAEDVLIIAEEFGEWEDSRRRIDLLGVDRNANLVVIELKRDDDGSHMELQALRYAAMVSTMTFARAIETYEAYLVGLGDGAENAKARLLSHLRWSEPREEGFAEDVRIVLVAAGFSKELTTAVLWLNDRDLDVRCVRLRPYAMDGEVVVDVQQVVPLPEAEAYTVQIKHKVQATRQEKSDRHALRRAFWSTLLPLAAERTPRFASVKPSDDHWVSTASGVPGLRWSYLVWQSASGGELYIDRGTVGSNAWNKAIFDYLHARRGEIESTYGGPLTWYRLDDKRASRIMEESLAGGIRASQDQWPEIHARMIDSMARLERALGPHLAGAAAAALRAAPSGAGDAPATSP